MRLISQSRQDEERRVWMHAEWRRVEDRRRADRRPAAAACSAVTHAPSEPWLAKHQLAKTSRLFSTSGLEGLQEQKNNTDRDGVSSERHAFAFVGLARCGTRFLPFPSLCQVFSL